MKSDFKGKLEKENSVLQKKEEELLRSKQEFAEKQRQAESLFHK